SGAFPTVGRTHLPPTHRRWVESSGCAVRDRIDIVGVAGPEIVPRGGGCDGTGARSTDVATTIGRVLASRWRRCRREFLGDCACSQHPNGHWDQFGGIRSFTSFSDSTPS